MPGKVQECCQDWFGVYPYDEVTDPKGPLQHPIGLCEAASGTVRRVIAAAPAASGARRTAVSGILVFVFVKHLE